MKGDYYTLPVPFKQLMEVKEVSRCDLQTSIAQKIHLVLVTAFEERRFKKNFGCLVWEYDFEAIYNASAWKDKVIKSITDTLAENERRLNSIQVTIDVTNEETQSKVNAIRKKLDIRITGNLFKTNESFVFSESIYVSPISLD